MRRQPYVHIFVHQDVLTTAREILQDIEENLDKPGLERLSEEDVRAFKDLTDPLPEEDIYGYIPNIRNSNLPVKS